MTSKTIVVIGIGIAILCLGPTALASNPELTLVEGFFAAGSVDLGTSTGRDWYNAQIQNLLTDYAAQHTPDPIAAARNLESAFATLGIPGQEIAQIQAVNDRYAERLLMQKTPAEIQAFWQQYSHDLESSLESMPYPQGDEFSACQWSVALMAGGLAIGVPLLAYTIGKGLGDQNVSPWIANPGALLTLLGIGSLIATIPTCLF